MRTLAALVAVTLVSVALAGSASAYSFSPTSTTFTALGSLTLAKSGSPVVCAASFGGSINKTGVGKFTAVTFTGSPTCMAVQATGLPWGFKAVSASRAMIRGMAASAGSLGTCGPSNVHVMVNATGVIKFNHAMLTGGCSVNGTVQTAPVITIVP
jgi:hypothetical protein